MTKTRAGIIFVFLFLMLIPAAFSLPAEVVYTEGEAYIQEHGGADYEALIGDEVNTGDSVKTGSDGYMELAQNYVTIKINPDTVFTLIPREEKSEKTDVFSLFLGSASFRYNVLTGKEPPVQTQSMVAGARGTEFTVLAGFDGSSMVVVKSGVVAVNSEGRTVSLKPREGVQVNPGEPPGEKFRVLIGKVDYRKWNEERFNSFIKDPVKAAERTKNRMKFYIRKISELYPLYLESRAKLDSKRAKNKEIKAKQGKEASKKYFKDVIVPLSLKTSNLVLNIRYYALSSLSLRRYIMGRMYMTLKTMYITDPANKSYTEFKKVFMQTLKLFEKSVVPQLVEADI
ncbi:MAG: FecR domain-containing protein [Spirochaetales bacterium]|nr:FecR domain-containing protein [Spirochaetales bacterium]